jgi:membrane protein DedA with SNARE-associated domain
VPIPVPADALMVAAAAQVASGAFVLWQAFLALLAALVVGGTLQFVLARGPARGLLYRSGRYLGLTPARLDAAADRVSGAGSLAIAVGVLLPGVRAVTVAGCGLAGVPLRRFLPGLVLGSTLFLAVHFALGYAGWILLGAVLLTVPTGAALAVGVLAAAGVVGWLAVRLRQRPGASSGDVAAEVVGAWQEATCPVCLLLGALGPVFPIAQEGHSHEPSVSTPAA